MTTTLPLASPEARAAERLRWGIIEFQVTDLQRAIAFWTRALGLQVRAQDSQRVELGTQAKTLFVFHAGATVPVSPRYSGMYHVAIGLPSQVEFSRLLARLISLRIPVAPTDHLLAKSLYLQDPDGLEIELTFETPERFGRFGDMSRGLVLYDAQGNTHSGRSALDVEAELSHAPKTGLDAPLSNDTYLAHMHFKVPHLEASASWFERIGFSRGLTLENWGFADLNASESHSHRLAMNVWAGPNLPPAPNTMARLIGYELLAQDPTVIENAKGMTPYEGGLKAVDPSGVEFSLKPAT